MQFRAAAMRFVFEMNFHLENFVLRLMERYKLVE